MKILERLTKTLSVTMMYFLYSSAAMAADKFATALQGDVEDTLGSGGKIWAILILVDILIATGSAIAAKNPWVFLPVLGIVFIPSVLLKVFVFG